MRDVIAGDAFWGWSGSLDDDLLLYAVVFWVEEWGGLFLFLRDCYTHSLFWFVRGRGSGGGVAFRRVVVYFPFFLRVVAGVLAGGRW